jgi:hypothetical protein
MIRAVSTSMDLYSDSNSLAALQLIVGLHSQAWKDVHKKRPAPTYDSSITKEPAQQVRYNTMST